MSGISGLINSIRQAVFSKFSSTTQVAPKGSPATGINGRDTQKTNLQSRVGSRFDKIVKTLEKPITTLLDKIKGNKREVEKEPMNVQEIGQNLIRFPILDIKEIKKEQEQEKEKGEICYPVLGESRGDMDQSLTDIEIVMACVATATQRPKDKELLDRMCFELEMVRAKGGASSYANRAIEYLKKLPEENSTTTVELQTLLENIKKDQEASKKPDSK